jgi:hypothetical protein
VRAFATKTIPKSASCSGPTTRITTRRVANTALKGVKMLDLMISPTDLVWGPGNGVDLAAPSTDLDLGFGSPFAYSSGGQGRMADAT